MPTSVPSAWDNSDPEGRHRAPSGRMVRLARRRFTADQRQEFERWLGAGERHTPWFSLSSRKPGAGSAGCAQLPWRLRFWRRSIGAAGISAGYPAHWRRRLPWLPASPGGALPAPATPQFSIVASTEVGMMRRISLPDGSVVRLNTDSAVAVAIHGDGAECPTGAR